jgi:predicted ester cyclase
MRSAFPDLEAHIDDLVAAEDKVAIRVSFRGTHQGICSDTASVVRQIS